MSANAVAASFCLVGDSSLLIRCADVLAERGGSVAAVVSGDRRVRDWARKSGHALHRRPAQLLEGGGDGFDWLVTIGHLRLLAPEVLRLPRRGAVNFHDGPLPRYAGLNAPAWGILAGETEWAVTWHRTEEEADSGAILSQRRFVLAPDETSLTLNSRCFDEGYAGFVELLPLLEEDSAGVPQELAERTWCGPHDRPAAGGVLDWQRPASELVRTVRALDFGPYDNPLATPKIVTGAGVWSVGRAAAAPAPHGAVAGTVVAVDGEALAVVAADGVVALSELKSLSGRPVGPAALLAEAGLAVGDQLPLLSCAELGGVGQAVQDAAPAERFWRRRLSRATSYELPFSAPVGEGGAAPSATTGGKGAAALAQAVDCAPADAAALGVLAWAQQTLESPDARPALAFGDAGLAQTAARSRGLLSSTVPLSTGVATDTVSGALAGWQAELVRVRRRGGYPLDLTGRTPQLSARASGSPSFAGPVALLFEGVDAPSDAALVFRPGPDGRCVVEGDPDRVSGAAVARIARRIDGLAAALAVAAQDGEAERQLADLPRLDGETQATLAAWNDTTQPFPRERCVHELVAERCGATPEATALSAGGRTLTFAELDAASSRLANVLSDRGVGVGEPVGVHLERSVDLVVAVLGVLKAGGAYLPLDPGFPRARLAYMLEHSGARVAITSRRAGPPPLTTDEGARATVDVLCLDGDRDELAAAPADTPEVAVSSCDLAYVIYTSGSTGRPKGVLVEHRNVANFFTGMDGVVRHDPPGVWLAVTSLSFDISVLELLWTLARGFHVVLYQGLDGQERKEQSTQASARSVSFSLFYFASDEGGAGQEKYRQLLEGARFADRNGFEAVWTPERHFHAFGGLYPNPAVTGAALAAVTERLSIRAGSCVLPLHDPVRVAEEWAVVDNLSGGRAGVAFAAGWQPDDFVLRPEAYQDRKTRLFEDMDVVARLWRGETVPRQGPLGMVDVRTLPRPVQPELPMWVTAAGNPETFVEGGRAGHYVLTHLLGQSVEELSDKIARYRDARREAGHEGEGRVTVMLHTFVEPDPVAAREAAREPLKAYLKSSVNLVAKYAWSFPTFRGADKAPDDALADLSPEELDGLLDHAFERYAETSGLIGSPESCRETVRRLSEAGADELACLVDFGISDARVLAGLEHLGRLRALAMVPQDAEEADDAESRTESVAELIERHGVTHLQCVPSMAAMLTADASSHAALGSLQELLIGGEAFPPALAAELAQLAPDVRITNMYGPTETTVWSSTHLLSGELGPVSIGRPIANTAIYILDERGRQLPPGLAGELWIGGEGVVRGYHRLPDETAARFRPDPFAGSANARMYRTGDLARWSEEGRLEFLGRVDFQVKVRGYRIELGEIEAVLESDDGVARAVVSARQDRSGDVRLCAYWVAAGEERPSPAALRARVASRVPAYMVPSTFTELVAFPLTPNGKVDRKSLPSPEVSGAPAPTARSTSAPAAGTERIIAEVWGAALGGAVVAADDNFFELGGHSLLAVRTHRELQTVLERTFPLTDIFRFPTVGALARHLDRSAGTVAATGATPTAQVATGRRGAARADARRAALERRSAARSGGRGGRR